MTEKKPLPAVVLNGEVLLCEASDLIKIFQLNVDADSYIDSIRIDDTAFVRVTIKEL